MADRTWRATSVRRQVGAPACGVLDTITLDRQQRHRRRVRMTTDGGRQLLLDLAEATYLADGDALETAEGLILVRAAEEPLIEVRARDGVQLARIAWHIGNRHTPAEITADAIHLQPDHVLEDMIRRLGGECRRVMRAFEPEGGAYGGHGALEAGHHHGGGHGHAHGAAAQAPRVWKGGE